MDRLDNLKIENAKIIFRNFTGEQSQYNRAGDRNFCVVLTDMNLVEQLKADGWNIKERPPREEGDDPFCYMQVKVMFGQYPPMIYLVNSKGKIQMDEDMIETFDNIEIANVDLVIRPYTWEVNGKQGIKAYVKTMYVTQREDEFASKYESE